MGVLEQPGELLAALGVLPAGFVVDVFVHDGVAGATAPGAELVQLVLWVLAFVVRAHTSIDGDSLAE